MKKLILIGCITSSALFGASTSNACPDLSKKSLNIEESRQIALDLKNFSSSGADVYFELLKKYNKTQDIEQYVVKDTLAEIGETLIYGDLLGIKYRIDDLVNISHKYSADSEPIRNLENEYSRILNSIDPKNGNWCNNGASDGIKQFVIKELREKRINTEE